MGKKKDALRSLNTGIRRRTQTQTLDRDAALVPEYRPLLEIFDNAYMCGSEADVRADVAEPSDSTSSQTIFRIYRLLVIALLLERIVTVLFFGLRCCCSTSLAPSTAGRLTPLHTRVASLRFLSIF
jgi:hypothetical protein